MHLRTQAREINERRIVPFSPKQENEKQEKLIDLIHFFEEIIVSTIFFLLLLKPKKKPMYINWV